MFVHEREDTRCKTRLHSRLVGYFQLFHRNAVAPDAHEALLRCVAERVLAVLVVEGGVAQAVEQFPGAVEVERVHHHRLETIALTVALAVDAARGQTTSSSRSIVTRV